MRDPQDVKPIRNHDEHELALGRIAQLMSAPETNIAESPEAKELEALVRAVVAYEHKHFPIREASEEAKTRFREEQEEQEEQ